MKEEGIHNITIASVFKYLQTNLPVSQPVPHVTTIGTMLKRHFHLRYKAVSPALVRYIDPTYNERRLWLARLLA